MTDARDAAVRAWIASLEERHLADLRVSELTRALRALSSVYVQRRAALARGAALESRGKRAAFALFYGPLHFLVVQHVVRSLGATETLPGTIVDLGCGSGAAGAAWALAASGAPPRLVGVDRHPWVLDEARWTYRRLGLDGVARRADVATFRPPAGLAVLAAYVLNELSDAGRTAVLDGALEAGRPERLLVIEPISRVVTPWWDGVRDRVHRAGGRVDEWIIQLDLPQVLRKLDRAAGLDHSQVKARSIYIRRV